jgi:HAD superfamily hydrolase (TIGR01509 family)
MFFSAIIFDLDGVIADTESVQLHAINLLLSPYGYSLSQEEWAREYVGHPIEDDVRKLRSRFQLDASAELLSAQRRATYSNLLKQATGLVPLPGLNPFLDELQTRHIPLGIASGSPRADILTVLRTLNLIERFGVIAAADEVKQAKPAPDVYLLAAARMNMPSKQCLAVEDSAPGIAAAKAAGMQAIGIPSAYTQHQDLGQADKLVTGFDELFQFLLGPESA